MKPISERLLLWFADDVMAGDLLEEFREERLPKLGRMRAELWYARQIVSIAWHGIPSGFLILCFLSVLCAGWLILMEIRLQHRGFGSRSFEDFLFLVQALLALLTVAARRAESLRAVTQALTGFAFIDAAMAIFKNVSASHFEGYAIIAGTLFATQSIVTFLTLRHTKLSQ